MINIGNRLKFLRREQKLTQKELAEKAGIQIRALQRYESNDSNPRYTTMQAISESLGLPVQCFLDVKELVEQHEEYLRAMPRGRRFKLLRICSDLNQEDLVKSIITIHMDNEEYMKNGYIVFDKATYISQQIRSFESDENEISDDLASDIASVFKISVDLLTYQRIPSAKEVIRLRYAANPMEKLIKTICLLNYDGLEKLLDYAQDLASMEKYTKPDPDEE